MKHTGIVRRFDELGRVTIPIELRRTMGLEDRAPVEIMTSEDGIVLKKYKPEEECSICGSDTHLIEVDGVTICLVCAHKVIKAVQDGEGV